MRRIARARSARRRRRRHEQRRSRISYYSGFLFRFGSSRNVGLCAGEAPAYTCVAGADEQCASDEFVREWKEFKELSDKYQAPKDVQIRMKGLVADLQPQIPAGYQWDDKKLRFVKTPQPKVVPSAPVSK